jgi:hypothetical protein
MPSSAAGGGAYSGTDSSGGGAPGGGGPVGSAILDRQHRVRAGTGVAPRETRPRSARLAATEQDAEASGELSGR